MSQNLSGTKGVSSVVQNQKLIVSPGVNGRAQQEIPSGQRSQQKGSMTVPTPSGNSQTMPSTPSAPTNGSPNAAESSLAQGGTPVVPFTRASVPGPSHSASSLILANCEQARQPPGGMILSPSTAPVPQRPARSNASSAASDSASSGTSLPSHAETTTSGPGPPSHAETTLVSSS